MATSVDEIQVNQLARDRFARTTETRIGKKRVLTPCVNLRSKNPNDTGSFVFLKTNYQCPQVNMLTVREFDADETLRPYLKEIQDESTKLAPTARGTSVKRVFDNTVIWVDSCGEYTLYEDDEIWDKISRSLNYHPIVRQYFQRMIAKKKAIGKGDARGWESTKLTSCTDFWLSLVDDSKLCQDVINYNTDVQVNLHADQGYPFIPPFFSEEMLEVTKKMNQRSSWFSIDRKQFAYAITPMPQIFRNDELLEGMIKFIESTSKGSIMIKPKGLILTDGKKAEARNRVRYFLNRIETFRQNNPKRLIAGIELGYNAYPFVCYGFDSVGTSFTGHEEEGGGNRGQKRFVGFSSYYSKAQMIHIPYTRLVSSVFPAQHKLPHDCEVCRPVNSLEGMPRDFWNFRITRPHFAVAWNEHMTDISRLINTNQIHKAKEPLVFSELCPLKSLIPDY